MSTVSLPPPYESLELGTESTEVPPPLYDSLTAAASLPPLPAYHSVDSLTDPTITAPSSSVDHTELATRHSQVTTHYHPSVRRSSRRNRALSGSSTNSIVTTTAPSSGSSCHHGPTDRTTAPSYSRHNPCAVTAEQTHSGGHDTSLRQTTDSAYTSADGSMAAILENSQSAQSDYGTNLSDRDRNNTAGHPTVNRSLQSNADGANRVIHSPNGRSGQTRSPGRRNGHSQNSSSHVVTGICGLALPSMLNKHRGKYGLQFYKSWGATLLHITLNVFGSISPIDIS